jgi:enoyl reductase-like protein
VRSKEAQIDATVAGLADLAVFEVYSLRKDKLWQASSARAVAGRVAAPIPGFGAVAMFGRGR